MKKIFLLTICLIVIAKLCFVQVTIAQNASVNNNTSFLTALDLYSDNRFQDAYELFIEINSAESQLFAAKCSYALSRFDESLRLVNHLSRNTEGAIKDEAIYLMALSYYQNGNYSESLRSLHQLTVNLESVVHREATEIYNTLMDYLSFNQRLKILESNVQLEIKRQVVSSYYQRYPRDQALILVNLLNRLDSSDNYSNQRQIANNLPEIAKLPGTSIRVPEGTIINVGIILPAFDFDPEDKEVSRALHNGFLIAVDAFNRQNNLQKIRIHYLNSDRIRNNFAREIKSFKDKHNIAVFVGPLFSEDVKNIESLSNELKVPFIAPLANTYRLNNPDGFVFQVNPSFEERGKITARLAVEKLGLQKFGIMVEKGSFGEIDANSFAEEVKNLGGEVVRFVKEDFESMGYFVGDHTPWFSNNRALIDTTRYVADTLDAVYLPFTGEAASTLLNLTLTGLETFQPDYVILSNEEINYLTHSIERMRRLSMVYTSTFNLKEGTEIAANFRYDYLNRTGSNPGSYSYIGYDIGKFFTELISRIKNPDDFKIFLPSFPPYEGISTSIHFGNSNSNGLLKMYKITPNGSVNIGN